MSIPAKKNIYLDYAAATPIDPEVASTITATMTEVFGNPSSVHSVGRRASQVLLEARKRIAFVIGAKADEIVFTSSATEANNVAILGIARANAHKGKHIITSVIEHDSILKVMRQLEKEGFLVTYLSVKSNGLIDLEEFRKAITQETILVSLGYVNSEIGIIQPIKELLAIVNNIPQEQKPLFHVDASQAVGLLPIQISQIAVDAMTFNSSKIYGPHGIGCLYLARSVNPQPILFGGSQERGIRPGTENVALALGFAHAFEMAEALRKKEVVRLAELKNYAIEQILNRISDTKLNGDTRERVANNINISFANTDGEILQAALDEHGIQVATGSACTARYTGPSHVIKALGMPQEYEKGNIRITLGRATTKEEIDELLVLLENLVSISRSI